MSDSIAVGSVIGGRYNVSDHILSTGENDQVFSGVDQVLNRPVSILVPAKANASQLASSARDIAVGERSGNMSILDLGTSGDDTFLITSRANPTDLLELLVPLVPVQEDAPAFSADSIFDGADSQPPTQAQPTTPDVTDYSTEGYQEPYYTDTLGSEIFGQEREDEPEPENDPNYIYPHYAEPQPVRALPPESLPPEPTYPEAAGSAEPLEPVQPYTDAEPQVHSSKVTAYDFASTEDDSLRPATHFPVAARGANLENDGVSDQRDSATGNARPGAAGSGAGSGATSGAGTAAVASAPTAAAPTAAAAAAGAGSIPPNEPPEKSSDSKGMRWIVGLILAALLVVCVFLAVNQLGSLLPQGNKTAATPSNSTASQSASPTPQPTATTKPEPIAVTRLIAGGIPDREAEHDNTLPALIDGNPQSAWVPYMYRSDNFGNYYASIGLVFQLKQEAPVKTVTMTTPDIAGGQFEILVNNQPSFDGAQKVGQGAFQKGQTTVELKGPDGQPPVAQYVIVNITQLPTSDRAAPNLPFQALINEVSFS